MNKRAGHLAFDLGWVDRMAGIGRSDDAVDLEPAFLLTDTSAQAATYQSP
jgi:hypothetical protein